MRPRIGSTRHVALAVVLVGIVGSALVAARDSPVSEGGGGPLPSAAAASLGGTSPRPEASPPVAGLAAAMPAVPSAVPAWTAAPSSSAPAPAAPGAVPVTTAVPASTGVPGSTARPSSSAPAPAAAPATRLAVVPVVGFWSPDRSISLARLGAILAGTDRQFRRVVVADPDLAPLATALEVRPGATVTSASAAAVLDAVRGTTDVIGFVRAGDVGPSVRALAVDGRSLFGNTRVRSIADWPLNIDGWPTTSAVFDPAATWTLVAAGDVMNDREVYRRTVLLGAGPDFPWDGGTARIVSRTCCRSGQTIVTAKRTGHAGAVRALFSDADLSLVNHEGPAPDRHAFHRTGLVFTFDPALEAGLRDAGVDIVSLANNHIRNAGSNGVVQTIRNVEAAGLTPVGAGKDATAARRPVHKAVNGVQVAVLAYDAIDLSSAGATASRAGAAPLDIKGARADIRAARAAGADVVIVVPHWGVEYTDRPTTLQRRQAAALVAAGADLILGSHSHWAGAMEAIDAGVVLYSLGDFIFDLPRSEQTEEGLVVELTFVGARLAQIEIHPTIQLDRSQPNLLDAKDGQVIIDRVRAASDGLLGW